MEKKIPIWVLVLVIFLGVNGAVLFGGAVHHVSMGKRGLGKLGRAAIEIAKFPLLVSETIDEVVGRSPLLIKNRFPEIDGFKKNGFLQEGALEDDGYLLLSAYNNSKEQSTVKLIRISDQQLLHEWVPDIQQLLESIQSKNPDFFSSRIQNSKYRIIHPLLLKDGSIIFQNMYGPLFKINTCSNIEWGIPGTFHHSITQDPDNNNFWVSSVIEPASYDKGIFVDYRDDAITKMSPEGKILFRKSVSKILEENGYSGLLFGAGPYDKDAIHLNDIQPAHYSTEFWEKGDLLLSMRHRSTVFIYRPSTNKIIWLKTGSWLNQHDPDFIGQSKISVFGNDVMSYASNTFSDERHSRHVSVNGHNDIYLFDFEDVSVSTPYSEVLEELDVRTPTHGRHEPLKNGDVFVEETNFGRILRVSPEKIIWEFVVRVDDDFAGLVSWSRYLTKEQVKDILPILEGTNCS